MRQIAALLSADTTLEQVFEHLCEALADVVDASVVFIALRHADDKVRLEYMHDHGVMRHVPRLEMPEGSSTHTVMQSGVSIIKHGSRDWPDRLEYSIPTQEHPNQDSVSAVYAPMRYGDQTLGVLSVQSTREGAYSDDDAHLIEAVAQYVAITVKGRFLNRIETRAPRFPREMFAVCLILLVLTAVLVVFASLREPEIRATALAEQRDRLSTITARADSADVEARQLARTTAIMLAPIRRDRAQAELQLMRLLQSAPSATIYGIGAYFEPYGFDPSRKYFGPWVHRKAGHPERLALSLLANAQAYGYPQRTWYRAGRTLGPEPGFTDPFYDSTNIFVSAVERLRDARRRFLGVVTVDMSQTQLRDYIPLHTSQAGEFAYVTTSAGVPFIFSDQEKLIRNARASGVRARTILDIPPAFLAAFIARTYPAPRTERIAPTEYTRWLIHLSSEDRVLFASVATFRQGLWAVALTIWGIGFLRLFALRQRHFHARRTRRLEIEKMELEHEIAERQRVEEELRRSAFTDALTGLPNRAQVINSLQHAIQRRAYNGEFWFGVFFLDIDRFNVINDSLGYAAGDALLIEVGRRLRAALHANHVVARIGGDEFILVARYLGENADPAVFAQLIVNLFMEPFKVADHEMFITVSIGIAPCESDYAAPEDLLRDADIALHRAKLSSERRFAVFDRAMHAHAVQRHRLENELRKALERRELFLVYQPVIELATGRAVGFEALIRWRHPQRGILAPGEFISVAEQTRLIIPMGKWILSEACHQVAAWSSRGVPDLWVSVNISAAQYGQAQLVSDVVEAIATSGIACSALKLEITESAIMNDAAATVRTLSELRRIGVRTQIDDFGTGYSSLSYLQQFPIDTLKIDQSFVSRMTDDPDSYEIVRAIVTLAKSLRLEVTAEGIEREQEVEALASLGVDNGQGYWFSRPLEAGDAIDFMTSRVR